MENEKNLFEDIEQTLWTDDQWLNVIEKLEKEAQDMALSSDVDVRALNVEKNLAQMLEKAYEILGENATPPLIREIYTVVGENVNWLDHAREVIGFFAPEENIEDHIILMKDGLNHGNIKAEDVAAGDVIVVGTRINYNTGKFDGSAKLAKDLGATKPIGYGSLCASAFGIITVRNVGEKRSVELWQIKNQLFGLYIHIRKNPDKLFYLTKIGCGYAGYTEEEIVGILPDKMPDNLIVPNGWEKYELEEVEV